MRFYRRHFACALIACAAPASACETQPDISQLPGETAEDAAKRFQKTFAEDYSLSMREDVSQDNIPPAFRFTKGTKFFPAYRPEYIDTKPALKVIEDAMRSVKKAEPR